MKVHGYDNYAKLKTFLKDHIGLLVDLGHGGKHVFAVNPENNSEWNRYVIAEGGADSAYMQAPVRQDTRSEESFGSGVPEEIMAMIQERAEGGDVEALAIHKQSNFRGKPRQRRFG